MLRVGAIQYDKEIMFSVTYIYLFVRLSISNITQKV